MKKLVIIAATAAALLFGQAAMAERGHWSRGHGGGSSIHWNSGGHGNQHNNGHRNRGGHGHGHKRHKPRVRQHCHTKRGHHGHIFKYCHPNHKPHRGH